MSEPNPAPYRVAVLWRGDNRARAQATTTDNRLSAIFGSLADQGMAAEPCVWSEDFDADVRVQLRGIDGVLVWVDPIATATGERRNALDALLRDVSATGVFVSTHPDVTAKMGVKAVLHRTRALGWGSDSWFYETYSAFTTEFPLRLGDGPRVLKQNRGNGGIGVWKVERKTGGNVLVQEARKASEPRTLPLSEFMSARATVFGEGGGLLDQAFQPRHLDGMVRCYMSGGQVVGFGHQLVRALSPPGAGPAGPRLYSGPLDARFQRLRAMMEREWTPGLCEVLSIPAETLPVIWDADFLLGPRTLEGEDSYVLCEINVSSVFPIPDEAPEALAKTTRLRLERARVRSNRSPKT